TSPPGRRRTPALPRRRGPRETRSETRSLHRGAVPLLALLALDAEPGVRDGPEAVAVDRLPAADADPIRAVPDPLQGFVHHLEHPLNVAQDGGRSPAAGPERHVWDLRRLRRSEEHTS